jgi:aminopeptidase N
MNRLFFLLALCTLFFTAAAQDGKTEALKVYRATTDKVNDLVHTKLDAKFDYQNAYLIGKAWITLKPHFYPTDTLTLDAKGMEIKSVAISKNGRNSNLKYSYDGMQLNIRLDRVYRNNEQYTVFIDYVAKPDEFEAQGSAAITDAKGLYFVNPRGEEPGKPTQIWTQGETEATSVWVPTIDKPNQKTTQEILMTVPSKYVTLSNGLLIKQTKNANGTRTDHWKMDLPHAPYLFFMGVGDYAVVKDKYKNKEVSYYVEKEYASVARKIFGHTPEMMAFFSRITGVEYPWAKYSQIVGRDYVSGAMENTTATLHQESAQQDARELTDRNAWEDVISHELIHHWFGDLVTAESWSNLSMNESFANYGETLWNEYKYGKDAGDAHGFSDMQGYMMSGSEKKDLIRFHYRDKEDMFDAVSYNKGGRVLHMLRNFVGDSAFFKSLNLYLTANRFKAAEAHNLRLAFEEVTGKDLNWFFNQWFFGSGHPRLEINYSYDAASKKANVNVKQTQAGDKVFTLPVAIDVYNGAEKTRYHVWVTNKTDSFSFHAATKPDLVNFDADKILLAAKNENKTLEEYRHQYKYAGNYLDRREAIDAAGRKQDEAVGAEILLNALNDKYHGLRSYAIAKLDIRKENIKTAAEPTLVKLAQTEKVRLVKAAAIGKLGDYKNPNYVSIFRAALNDSSYTVSGNALEALGKVDSLAAYAEAKNFAKMKIKGKLAGVTTNAMIKYGDDSASDIILGNFEEMPLGQQKFEAIKPLTDFLAKTKSMETLKRGVDAIIKFNGEVPEQFRDQVTPFIEGLLKGVQKAKSDAGQKEMADYIDSRLSKKGF